MLRLTQLERWERVLMNKGKRRRQGGHATNQAFGCSVLFTQSAQCVVD